MGLHLFWVKIVSIPEVNHETHTIGGQKQCNGKKEANFLSKLHD